MNSGEKITKKVVLNRDFCNLMFVFHLQVSPRTHAIETSCVSIVRANSGTALGREDIGFESRMGGPRVSGPAGHLFCYFLVAFRQPSAK